LWHHLVAEVWKVCKNRKSDQTC